MHMHMHTHKYAQDKGQAFAIQLPDELTITHAWRDEKKHREYNFDQVRIHAC
jgi:hypothetical protein